MSATRAALFTLALALAVALSAPRAQAAPPEAESEETSEPGDFEAAGGLYAPFVREHFYRVLMRSPTKAFLWELALPGAGHFYNGFPIQAGVAIGLSLAGAGLWIAGAARESPLLWWLGMGTFNAGRVYGLISAPVTAVLLNAAYRRQLGITGRF
jgi:hypothetical protein